MALVIHNTVYCLQNICSSIISLLGEMQVSMVIAFPFDSQVKELSCQDGLIQPEQ